MTTEIDVEHQEPSWMTVGEAAARAQVGNKVIYREAVAGRTLDELLNARVKVDTEIVEHVRRALGDVGVRVTELGIKDVILPGEMRELINRVVEAEKVAQANLIRRREETAATRSLLNTAKLMADNPVLMRLLSELLDPSQF